MKIACQACQAKYTIADEKVVGKIVKIRCKKCGATIVINGNESEAATQVAQQPGAGQAFDYAAGGSEPWTVNVADGDQRTMTTEELVAAFHAGVVNEETFCWKDGMSDWLPLREIGELSAATAGGAAAPAAPAAADEEATAAMPAGGGAGFSSLFGGGGNGGAPAQNGGALFGGAPAATPPPAAAPAAAARRAGGRAAGGADLFSGVHTAGGEDDVMTSASAAGAAGAGAGESKTGERNENSVLFSLSALTQNAPPQESKTTATAEGSGLIDIRALSSAVSEKEQKQGPKHVDDIMNLGGGGAFAPALAAPVLAAPPPDVAEPLHGEKKKSNVGLIVGLVLGLAVILGGAGIVIAMLLKPKEPVVVASNNTTSTTTSATPTPTETSASTGPVATNDTPSTAAPPGTGASTAKTPSTGGNTTASRPTGGNPVGVNTGVAAPPPPPPNTGSSGGGCCPGESEMQCNMRKSAGQPCPASAPANTAAAGGAPFDRGAAAGALGGVNLSSCKKPDGPSGSGHVKVTFQPNGTVSTVEVDQPPFSGTAVGGCIAGKYRGVKIPAFSGSSVTVGKSFSLN